MRTLILISTVLAASTGVRKVEAQHPSPSASPIPTTSQQLLLVRSASWYATKGTLARYDRDGTNGWRLFASTVPVDIGRKGMAWGLGLHAIGNAGPVKREGDGRTPAGAFPLGRAFGRAETLPATTHWTDYMQTQPTTYCVEDVRSSSYNQFIDTDGVRSTRWERRSPMLRPDGLFDWGLVIRQNALGVGGGGSCVFLHIWRGANHPTSGCTAMSRDSILETFAWLMDAANPILVQLPEPAFRNLQDAWSLPRSD